MKIISMTALITFCFLMYFILNRLYFYFFYKREAVTDLRYSDNKELAKYLADVYRRVESENFIRDDCYVFDNRKIL